MPAQSHTSICVHCLREQRKGGEMGEMVSLKKKMIQECQRC